MQVEGTETPTALTPNTTGESNTTKSDSGEHIIDTTPGNNQVDFPAVLVQGFSPSQPESNTTNQSTNDTANTAKPTPVDTKQVTPENSSPATQTQRSETTSPNTQDTSGNSGGSSSSTNQNNRGDSAAPQMQISTSVPTFTPFDSSLAGAPKSALITIRSNQSEEQNQKSQSERANSDRPDWFNDPFSPHNPALKNYLFNNKPPHTSPTAAKFKKKKGKSRKKTDREPVKVDGLQIMIDGKLVPLQDFGKPPENETEEQEAKRERDDVVRKIEDYHTEHPHSPIPLTKEDIIKIFRNRIIQLQKNKQEQLSNQLADSEFVNSLYEQGPNGGNSPYTYDVLDEIGGNKPGVYDGGTLNYIYQGIISAFHGDSKGTLEAKIIGYNNSFKPVQILVNKIHSDSFPYVGKYEDNEVVVNFGDFGYDFYNENFK